MTTREMVLIGLSELGIFETLFAIMWFMCPAMDVLEIIFVDFMITFTVSWALWREEDGETGEKRRHSQRRIRP